MKHLAIIRHAKSSWSDFSIADIDRPLNSRGKRDAPKMARHLHSIGWLPDQFIASPSKRTRRTAKHFLKTYNKPSEELEISNALYHGLASDFIDTMFGIPDDHDYIVMFGHNPSITEIANLCSEEYITNVPTCGILIIEMQIDNWIDASWDKATLMTSYFPKLV